MDGREIGTRNYWLLVVIEQRWSKKLLPLLEDLIGQHPLVRPRLVVEGGQRRRRGGEAAAEKLAELHLRSEAAPPQIAPEEHRRREGEYELGLVRRGRGGSGGPSHFPLV